MFSSFVNLLTQVEQLLIREGIQLDCGSSVLELAQNPSCLVCCSLQTSLIPGLVPPGGPELLQKLLTDRVSSVVPISTKLPDQVPQGFIMIILDHILTQLHILRCTDGTLSLTDCNLRHCNIFRLLFNRNAFTAFHLHPVEEARWDLVDRYDLRCAPRNAKPRIIGVFCLHSHSL